MHTVLFFSGVRCFPSHGDGPRDPPSPRSAGDDQRREQEQLQEVSKVTNG